MRNLAHQLYFRLLLAGMALGPGATLSSAYDVWGDNGSTPIGSQTNAPPPGTNTPPPCNPGKCPPDPGCTTGDPVYPANGRFYLQLTDYELPAELPIVIRRLYSTLFAYNGLFGYGWNMSYNERLFRLADGKLLVRWDNDVMDEFTNAAPHLFRAPVGKADTITENLDGTYTLRKPDGTIHLFSNAGTLAKIENVKGYQLLFTYDPQGKWPINGVSQYSHIANPILIGRDYRLTRIDQARNGVSNGKYVTFAYNGDGRMTNILIYAGNPPPLSLSYAYSADGRGDLTAYTDAAGTSFTYAYDGLHRMTNFPTGECACRSGQNTYDSTNRVTRQVLGSTIVDFSYLVPGQQTRITTHIYDEQTLLWVRDRIEYFYFTPTGKTAKYVLQMGNYLDPAGGESDDLVTSYRYDPVTDALLGVDASGVQTKSYVYDANGYVASETITNGAELITRVNQHDANGLVTNQFVLSSLWPGVQFGRQAMIYDLQGRLLTEKRIGTNGTELTTLYQYTPLGDHEVVTVTDPEGSRISREVDENGRVVWEYDPDNPARQTRFQYDGRGNLTAKTNALGAVTLFEYDALNRLVRETNPLGLQNIYTFDGGNLVRVETGKSTNAPGHITLYDYNSSSHRVAEYRVGDGRTNLWARFGYDSDGKLIWEDNALGLRTAYNYDPAGRKIVTTDIYGGRSTNVFDKFGNTLSTRNALGVETRFNYDSLGRMTSRVLAAGTSLARTNAYKFTPLGQVYEIAWPDASASIYSYDELGRLAAVSGTREAPVSYQYDRNGRIVVVTDGNAFSRTNRYDSAGLLSQVVSPDGAVESFNYDLLGNLVARKDVRSNSVFYTYDLLGRRQTESLPNNSNSILSRVVFDAWSNPILASNAVGHLDQMFYDQLGRLAYSINAAGLRLTNTYDIFDQLSSIMWPNGTYVSNLYAGTRLAATQDRAGRLTRLGYDLLGRKILEVTPLGLTNLLTYDALNRLTSVSNSLGQVVRREYDLFDQLVRVTHADGQDERFDYDAYGRLTSHYGAGQLAVAFHYDPAGNQTNLVDGNGNVTSWTYDSRNRVKRKIFPDATYFEFTYDQNGNVVARRDGAGSVTTYAYDPANRLVLTHYPDAADVVWAYDAAGRRTSLVDGSGTNLWFYDVSDRVVTNFQSRCATTIAYAYDLEGHRTAMDFAGLRVAYFYDAAGRLARITNAAGSFACAWLAGADLLQAVTYPNGATLTNQYDVAGKLGSRRNANGAGTVLSSLAYGYNAVGLRTNVLLADGSRVAWQYDSARQLIAASGYLPGGSLRSDYQFAFAYDPAGNRTNALENGRQTIYQPNALNQYAYAATLDGSWLTNRFTYDANGNLTASGSPGVGTCRWDHEARLVTLSNATHRTEFVYSALGNRVEQREYNAGGVLTQTRRYLYDESLPVAELDDLNGLVMQWTYGIDLSQTVGGAGGIGGLLATVAFPAIQPRFCFSDGNGNITQVIDTGNVLVGAYEYDPFGNLTAQSGSAPQVNEQRFSSKPWHAASGLYYFGLRYYWPLLGRWITRDPAGESEGPGLYAYVKNDPLDRFDPFGDKVSMDGSCKCFCKGSPTALEDAIKGLQAKLSDTCAQVKFNYTKKGDRTPNSRKFSDKIEFSDIKVSCSKGTSGCGGWSSKGTISLGTSACNVSSCGALDSTVLHEMVHDWANNRPPYDKKEYKVDGVTAHVAGYGEWTWLDEWAARYVEKNCFKYDPWSLP